jgi:hypothetical protein
VACIRPAVTTWRSGGSIFSPAPASCHDSTFNTTNTPLSSTISTSHWSNPPANLRSQYGYRHLSSRRRGHVSHCPSHWRRYRSYPARLDRRKPPVRKSMALRSLGLTKRATLTSFTAAISSTRNFDWQRSFLTTFVSAGESLFTGIALVVLSHSLISLIKVFRYGYADNSGQVGRDAYPGRHVMLIIAVLIGDRILPSHLIHFHPRAPTYPLT